MSYDGFISYSHAADDLLAPRLQSALQRFAKPWWKRRAVRIFRDESSLSANPHLWSSITEALDASGWFVLLLSPDAAQSEWVNQEISYWVENRDPKKILPVVTDGTFDWTGGDVTGDAVPDALSGVFTEEPRWVDVRWAKDEDQLDLQDPRFADAVADIASTIRGIPKDDLASEEVRQHRRTIRTAWAAGALVTVLAVAAVGFGVQSAGNAAEADRQAQVAEENAAEANRQAQIAENNADAAEANAQIAAVRELAASAIGVLDADPELAVLLGLQAIRSAPDTDDPPAEARIALRQAVQTSYLIARYEVDLAGSEVNFADLSPSGTDLVVSGDRAIQVLDLESGRTDWEWDVSDLAPPGGVPGYMCVSEAFYSRSGDEIRVGLLDGAGLCGLKVEDGHVSGSGLAILDAATGEVQRVEWLATCPDLLTGAESPNGGLVPVVTPLDGDCAPGTELDWTIALLDTQTLERVRTIPVPDIGMTSWSADGSRISIGAFYGWGAVVYDSETGEAIAELGDNFFFGYLSPDGTQLAGSDINRSVLIYDVQSSQLVDRLPDLADPPFDIGWSGDGQRIFAVARGPRAVVWDAAAGTVETIIPNAGVGYRVLLDDATDRLIHVGPDTVTIADVSGQVEGSSNTASVPGFVQANSVTTGVGRGAFMFMNSEWYVGTFDVASGVLSNSTRPTPTGRRTAVLDDGRILLVDGEDSGDEVTRGPTIVWDPATGAEQEVLGCPGLVTSEDFRNVGTWGETKVGPCADRPGDYMDVDRILMSSDRTRVIVTSTDGSFVVLDPHTLEQVGEGSLPERGEALRDVGDDWIATTNFPTNVTTGGRTITLRRFPSLEPVVTVSGTWTETNPTGTVLAVDTGPGAVALIDTESGDIIREFRGGVGRIRGLAFSLDGSMLMVSATDGFVRIWSVSDGAEIERVPIGDGQDGSGDGYWVDEDTIAIAQANGRWTNIDIGLDSLLSLARSRLIRGFSDTECLTYRIDPCPTLEEMRVGS